MSFIKEQQFNRERERALSELLVAECKSVASSKESVLAILESGADIDFKNSRPLYVAAKYHRFDIVELLIRQGAKVDGIGKTYVAAMCDFKGFCDEMEEPFFNTLDIVYSKEGNYMELFTPYINSMAVLGRIDKLLALMSRYYLTEAEVAKAVYIRIIFEIINNGHDKMLQFIDRHNKWMNAESLDLAVSTNEWQVLEHFIINGKYQAPSEYAVAQTVFNGNFETLYILKRVGYIFKDKPLVIQKAIEAGNSRSTKPMEFLLENGVSLTDRLRGKTIESHIILSGGKLTNKLG